MTGDGDNRTSWYLIVKQDVKSNYPHKHNVKSVIIHTDRKKNLKNSMRSVQSF